jgi:dihydroxyacetone kinase-like predicted kinase
MKEDSGDTGYDKILSSLRKQIKGKEAWTRLRIITEESKQDERKYINIENLHVGFCFNMKGDFMGIYNWKD